MMIGSENVKTTASLSRKKVFSSTDGPGKPEGQRPGQRTLWWS